MITFKEFMSLNEGGWSKNETQGTKLTPAIAKEALSFMPEFEKDFNIFLKGQDLPPIKIGKPVGSSAYIERDLIKDPEKEYGDIDILMVIPRLEGLSESKNNVLYSAAVKSFVGQKERPYLLHDEGNFGNSIIIRLSEDNYAQVDLVRVFGDVVHWTEKRMTPEHGLKGALLGNLYTSFGDLLNIGLGPAGVVAKERDGEFVPYRTIKVDKHHVLSLDFSNFMLAILKAVADRQHLNDPKIHPMLLKHPGMNYENVKATDLANSIKGIGKTFELNDMYGKGQLRNISSYDDFINKIKKIYIDKNLKAAQDTKFTKATTPEAKIRAEATIDLLVNKAKQIANLLD